MVVGDGVRLVDDDVDEDGGEDGVSVEYMGLTNVVTVGFSEEDGDDDDGGTLIYVVVGMPVFDA